MQSPATIFLLYNEDIWVCDQVNMKWWIRLSCLISFYLHLKQCRTWHLHWQNTQLNYIKLKWTTFIIWMLAINASSLLEVICDVVIVVSGFFISTVTTPVVSLVNLVHTWLLVNQWFISFSRHSKLLCWICPVLVQWLCLILSLFLA